MTFVRGKNKDDYLTEVTTPNKEDPAFKIWKPKNNMVTSWLINSMTDEIGENFLPDCTTKQIWDATKETFPALRIPQNCFLLKALFLTYNKEIHLSPNISTSQMTLATT